MEIESEIAVIQNDIKTILLWHDRHEILHDKKEAEDRERNNLLFNKITDVVSSVNKTDININTLLTNQKNQGKRIDEQATAIGKFFENSKISIWKIVQVAIGIFSIGAILLSTGVLKWRL